MAPQSTTTTEGTPIGNGRSANSIEEPVNGGGTSFRQNDHPPSSSLLTNNTDNNATTTTTALSLQELLYSSNSFHAICKPVTLTMILSALAVIYIREPNTRSQQEEAYTSYYTVWSTSSSDTNNDASDLGRNVGVSLANALIIVCVICTMTFGIVLLYKFKCFKCLMGYMMLSSSMLLGFLGSEMLRTSVNTYNLSLDKISYYICLYNFALVGIFSIFWQYGGIPTYVTQGYLVMTSVLLAWQLSLFDEWTTWTLLVMLALYDLCAVLTPCGPLKALINVMSRDDSPGMVPGLLYEAQLPSGMQRPNRSSSSSASSQQQTSSRNNGSSTETVSAHPNSTPGTNNNMERQSSSSRRTTNRSSNGDENVGIEMAPTRNNSHYSRESNRQEENPLGSTNTTNDAPSTSRPATTRMLPIAIAKVYKLRYLDHPGVPPYAAPQPSVEGEENRRSVNQQYTPEQLTTIVECVFPRRGGRIDAVTSENDGEPHYIVKDRHGVIKRTLIVDRHGKVFERRETTDDGEDDDSVNGRTSIKLGLGDFIFYSLLVSRAALYSFTTFAACTLVILTGLGSTLVLLSVYGKALPALPISIFLGVSFYLLTRILMEPWIETIFQHANYV